MSEVGIVTGDLLTGEHDVIVNAVNCVGVMGAGVALAIRRAAGYEYFKCYERACAEGRVRLGGIHVWDMRPAFPSAIVNFPTMHVPGGEVNPAALRLSMQRLRDFLLVESNSSRTPLSVGIPALGCGIGGFTFHDLIPIVRHGLDNLTDVNVYLYKPW